jgi:hypothetical protein
MAVIAKKLRHGWLPCDLAFNTSSLVISPGVLNSETELAADLARMGLGDYGGNK